MLTKLATAVSGMTLRIKGDPDSEPSESDLNNTKPEEADGANVSQIRVASKGAAALAPEEDKQTTEKASNETEVKSVKLKEAGNL